MAAVTGTLKTFGMESLTGKQPMIVFEANKPAMGSGGELFATDPIKVTPASDGAFSARLQPTENLTSDGVHYKMWIEYLDSANNYVRVDNPDWTLRVPTAGGSLGDLLQLPKLNSALVITSPTRPAVWLGLGAMWLQMDPNDPNNPNNPANTGDLYELRNA